MNKALQSALKDLRANKISGLEFCHRHSNAMDKYVRELTKDLISEDIAIIATGGYGRKELCPYSDIDLLFLTPPKAPQSLHDNIEKFLYQIWDSGIKIGHSVRTIKECIAVSHEDSKVLSSLLDARLIGGNKDLFAEFHDTFDKSLKTRAIKSYVTGKLEERDTRHQRFGDSRYVLEPNIKDGKGSLRDYQTLFWIAQVIYHANTPEALQEQKILTKKERQDIEKAHNFLLTVRCHLHDIAERAEERLHFDIQPALAERLGYQHRNNAKAVERFMKHYFLVTKEIGDLTRILVASMEDNEEQKNRLVPQRPKSYLGFEIVNERLKFSPSQKLKNHPIDILRFFRVAQENDLDIHPSALQKIRRNISLIDGALLHNKLANSIFLEILTAEKHAAQTLRRMNESGVLERFIPEFRKIKGLMQFDRYHTYTVDEHTLNAVDIMHKLESGALKDKAPLASTLIQTIENRKTLYLAIFLHDMCKGREKKKKGEDHSTLGAELALQLCPRLGLSDKGTRIVSWLIFEHLFMSKMAFKRDLDDTKTIEECVFRIHDLERLKLLTILTTADIMAVGPDCWTGWKDKLLSDLYAKIESRFINESPDTTEKAEPGIPEDWDTQSPYINITQDEEKNATIINVFTQDKPRLFATLSGALAASGANIIEARIQTHKNGMIADTFTVQNLSGQPIIKAHRHKEIKNTIETALNGQCDIEKSITKLEKPPKSKDLVFDVTPSVEINNNTSANNTFIEIHARDRHALLYSIAKVFADHKISIKMAKINTLGLKVEDVFYITDENGKKISGKKTLTTLQTDLKNKISESI